MPATDRARSTNTGGTKPHPKTPSSRRNGEKSTPCSHFQPLLEAWQWLLWVEIAWNMRGDSTSMILAGGPRNFVTWRKAWGAPLWNMLVIDLTYLACCCCVYYAITGQSTCQPCLHSHFGNIPQWSCRSAVAKNMSQCMCMRNIKKLRLTDIHKPHTRGWCKKGRRTKIIHPVMYRGWCFLLSWKWMRPAFPEIEAG